METLSPVDNRFKVPQLRKGYVTEFEVHASLYSALRANGFDVRGEVKWRDKLTRCSCRFDLVLYRNDLPVEIVEVKAGRVTHRSGLENTRQGRRYRLFGVPVTFVYGAEDAQAFLEAKLRERGI